jgi:hypothetical protein
MTVTVGTTRIAGRFCSWATMGAAARLIAHSAT